MRAYSLTAVIFGALMLVPLDGPALAQEGTPSPSDSACTRTAAAGNHAPTASLKATPSTTGATAARIFTLTATATDPDGDELSYTYTSTGGRVSGDGPTRVWNLSGNSPGTYDVSIFVEDGRGCWASYRITVSTEG